MNNKTNDNIKNDNIQNEKNNNRKKQDDIAFTNDYELIVGVDEAGRGCLAGRVYAGAVIWSSKNPTLNNENSLHHLVKDSKKLTPQQREAVYNYIIENAIDYGIGYAEPEEIDKYNIREATFLAMYRAIDNLTIKFDKLLIDGNDFKMYSDIPHQCIDDGDALYYCIAAGSILAKVEHDRYIRKLVDIDPSLDEKYGWLSNVSYGAKNHIDGIKKYGITKYHRKTFGICSSYVK